MAIEPKVEYPAQTIDTDSGYPYGKARNDTMEGSTDGTPLEKTWLNDLWGFLQALLEQAAIAPSGTPDKYGASQYLEAIREVISDDVLGSAVYPDLLDQIINSLLDGMVYNPPLIPVRNANDRFVAQYETNDAALQQNDITDAGKVVIPFALPYKNLNLKANSAFLRLAGASGHGALPATMPTFALYERTIAGVGSPPTLIGTVTDTSATTGAYETPHLLTLTFAERAILASTQYLFVITGEAGANSKVGLEVYQAEVIITD